MQIDPVKAAVPLLAQVYGLADKYASVAKLAIAFLDAPPGIKNTIPGQLKISLGVRHTGDAILSAWGRVT